MIIKNMRFEIIYHENDKNAAIVFKHNAIKNRKITYPI